MSEVAISYRNRFTENIIATNVNTRRSVCQ